MRSLIVVLLIEAQLSPDKPGITFFFRDELLIVEAKQ